jgi:hypothetical protein
MFIDIIENSEFLIEATIPTILFLFIYIDSSNLPD